MPGLRGPWSLRGQLIAAFVGVLLVAMGVLGIIVPELARAHALATLEERLAAEAQLLADHAASLLAQGAEADLDALAKRLGARTGTRLTLIALDGTVVGESHQELALVGNHAGRQEVQEALATGRGRSLHYSETVGYAMLYVAVPIWAEGRLLGTARAALPVSEVDRLVAQLTRTILVAAAGGALLAIGVAVLAARAITRPLARLTQQAGALAANPARGRGAAPLAGPVEVRQLGRALDELAAAVRESLQRVAAERDRLDAVLAHLADGVVIVDNTGRVAQLNPAAARLLGREAALAVGRTVAEVLRDHELVRLVEQARLGAEAPAVATAFVEWSQPPRFLRAAVSRFGTGAATQTLLVLQDLTELRRLETIRRDFVANVSHELRTPIAAIKAMVETLQDGALNDPAAARDFLGRIEQEVEGLHRLVAELLELSRLEAGQVPLQRVPTDPGRLVAQAVHRLAPLAERAGVSLTTALPPALPPVLVDAERMEQVLVSIVHNAIKFTPPGGAVVVRAAAEDGHVRLAVADTGVGIAPEHLPRIFERFYKADQARAGGGTGLGLAIAKHVVQLHGGAIWAESAGPGQGTTVQIRLPAG
jgi:two-component system phosphate regulon sensor histidine kinase PhoR